MVENWETHLFFVYFSLTALTFLLTNMFTQCSCRRITSTDTHTPGWTNSLWREILHWSSIKPPQTQEPPHNSMHPFIHCILPDSTCYGPDTVLHVWRCTITLSKGVTITAFIWQQCAAACPHKARHWNLDLIQQWELLLLSCDLRGWRLHFLLMERGVCVCVCEW